MADPQVVHRKASGLFTNRNPALAPEGALVEAENVVINSQGKISKVRGFERYGDQLSNPPTKLLQYQDTLIVHDGKRLKYDSDGTGDWQDWTGTFSSPDSSQKIRSTQARSNFYFTTSNGIYKNDSISGTPVKAGLPSPSPIQLTMVFPVGYSWLSPQEQVSYKITFVREDANGLLIESAPTPNLYSRNHDESNDGTPVFSIRCPPGIKVGDKILFYRTAAAALSADVGDTHYLAHELTIDQNMLDTKVYLWDMLTEAFLDTSRELYTNSTQETAFQSNDRPGRAKDVATYKGYTFYANVTRPHSVDFRLVDIDYLTADYSDLYIQCGEKQLVLAFTTSGTGSYDVRIEDDYAEAYNVEYTCGFGLYSIVSRINNLNWRYPTSYPFHAEYISTESDPPGKMRITSDNFTDTDIVVWSTDILAWGGSGSQTWSTTSTQEVGSNLLYHSKFEQPEAVPAGNVDAIGSEDSPILRILPLRNALIILKEEGVFILTGTTEVDFDIRPLDPTVRIDAPETAVVLNNAVFCSSNQGVVRIDEATGVSIVSQQIEEDLREIQAFSNYTALTHACTYESDRQYWLWVPESSSDTYATIAYVYNYLTHTWTIRRKNCGCAMVLHDTKTLYLGHAVDHYVLEERKSISGVSDFIDETISTTVSSHTTTEDDDGNTVTQLVCSYGYTSATLGIGWLFKYEDQEAAVIAATDNEDGTYTLDLSGQLTLPTLATPSSTVGLPDILGLIGLPTASTQTAFEASLGIPIVSTITWIPEACGNPSAMKQFSRCQLDFTENWVYKHELAFVTNFYGDQTYETGTLQFVTPGWGAGGWGGMPWDEDQIPAIPIATYIPTDCQRAQWLRVTYRHKWAYEKFDITNMAITFRVTGGRTVREPA